MKKTIYGLCSLIILVLISCGGEVATEPPAISPAGGTAQDGGGRAQAQFIHTVLFWLKDGASEEDKQRLIEDCKNLLGPISSVRYLAAGPPAGTSRGVVDNSYAVGLLVHFDDQAGHDLYQEAPAHLEFIERNQETWERVQVYDIQAE